MHYISIMPENSLDPNSSLLITLHHAPSQSQLLADSHRFLFLSLVTGLDSTETESCNTLSCAFVHSTQWY